MPNPDTITWDVSVANRPFPEFITWDVSTRGQRTAVTWDAAVSRRRVAEVTWDVRVIPVLATTYDAAVSEEEGTFRGVVETEADRDALPMLVPGDTVVVMAPSSGLRAREQQYTGAGWLESSASGGPEGKQKRRNVFPTKTGWWLELGDSDQPLRFTNGEITPFYLSDAGSITFQLATLGTEISVLDTDDVERAIISSQRGIRSFGTAQSPALVGAFGEREIYMQALPEQVAGVPDIDVTLLFGYGTSANASQYVQPTSFTAEADKWLLIAFEYATQDTPIAQATIADQYGGGYNLRADAIYRTDSRRLLVWTHKPFVTRPITLTFDLGTDVMTRGRWVVMQLDGVNGSDPIAAIVDTETDPGGTTNNGTSWSLSRTYADVANRGLFIIAHDEYEPVDWTADPQGPYEKIVNIGTQNPGGDLSVGWLRGSQDASPSVTWDTASAFGGVWVELAVGASLPAIPPVAGIIADAPPDAELLAPDDTDPEGAVTLYARRWPEPDHLAPAWYMVHGGAGTQERRIVGPHRLDSNASGFGASTSGTNIAFLIIDPGFIRAEQLWRILAWGVASCPSDASPTNHSFTLDLDLGNPGVHVITLPLVTPTSQAQTDEPWELEFLVGWRANTPGEPGYRAIGKLFTSYGPQSFQMAHATSGTGSGAPDATTVLNVSVKMTLAEATAGYALTSHYYAFMVD